MTEVVIYQNQPKRKTKRPMRFRPRDMEIIQAIYERGGVLAKRQLKELFWPDKSARAMEKRLAKLYDAGFITWPSREQWRSKPLPESIVWLAMQGILLIASQSGTGVKAPTSSNENGLRILEKQLRNEGIHWVREPRWSMVEHDLAVNDIRLAVEGAVAKLAGLELEVWVHEGAFRSQTDVIEYEVKQTPGSVKKLKKGVLPDSYFVLVDESRRQQETLARARFLLEIDRSTHDNPSFGREKVLPGIAYLLSSAYKDRFGANSGRWLVVTTGERRLTNLKRQTETVAGRDANTFFFTTFDKVRSETVLTQPIWVQGGEEKPRPLFD